MSLRPVDLPELRSELLAHYHDPRVAAWWSTRKARPAMTVHREDGAILVCDPSGEERRTAEIRLLENAELFFVSADMTELAVAAGSSMPIFAVAEEDLPAPRGFIVFEKPIATDRNFTGEEVPVTAATWWILPNPQLGPMLWFSFYIDAHGALDASVEEGLLTAAEAQARKQAQPRYTYSTDAAQILGVEADPNDQSVLNLWGRTIVAAWLLMQQSLAVRSTVEPDRAARKRLRRQGQEPKAVRVIELRRPKGGGAGDGSREYHHQWIVRGHWRQQWYPARQVHRPVWIAPHIKGPEGAPMIGGEKVYAWKR